MSISSIHLLDECHDPLDKIQGISELFLSGGSVFFSGDGLSGLGDVLKSSIDEIRKNITKAQECDGKEVAPADNRANQKFKRLLENILDLVESPGETPDLKILSKNIRKTLEAQA